MPTDLYVVYDEHISSATTVTVAPLGDIAVVRLKDANGVLQHAVNNERWLSANETPVPTVWLKLDWSAVGPHAALFAGLVWPEWPQEITPDTNIPAYRSPRYALVFRRPDGVLLMDRGDINTETASRSAYPWVTTPSGNWLMTWGGYHPTVGYNWQGPDIEAHVNWGVETYLRIEVPSTNDTWNAFGFSARAVAENPPAPTWWTWQPGDDHAGWPGHGYTHNPIGMSTVARPTNAIGIIMRQESMLDGGDSIGYRDILIGYSQETGPTYHGVISKNNDIWDRTRAMTNDTSLVRPPLAQSANGFISSMSLGSDFWSGVPDPQLPSGPYVSASKGPGHVIWSTLHTPYPSPTRPMATTASFYVQYPWGTGNTRKQLIYRVTDANGYSSSSTFNSGPYDSAAYDALLSVSAYYNIVRVEIWANVLYADVAKAPPDLIWDNGANFFLYETSKADFTLGALSHAEGHVVSTDAPLDDLPAITSTAQKGVEVLVQVAAAPNSVWLQMLDGDHFYELDKNTGEIVTELPRLDLRIESSPLSSSYYRYQNGYDYHTPYVVGAIPSEDGIYIELMVGYQYSNQYSNVYLSNTHWMWRFNVLTHELERMGWLPYISGPTTQLELVGRVGTFSYLVAYNSNTEMHAGRYFEISTLFALTTYDVTASGYAYVGRGRLENPGSYSQDLDFIGTDGDYIYSSRYNWHKDGTHFWIDGEQQSANLDPGDGFLEIMRHRLPPARDPRDATVLPAWQSQFTTGALLGWTITNGDYAVIPVEEAPPGWMPTSDSGFILKVQHAADSFETISIESDLIPISGPVPNWTSGVRWLLNAAPESIDTQAYVQVQGTYYNADGQALYTVDSSAGATPGYPYESWWRFLSYRAPSNSVGFRLRINVDIYSDSQTLSFSDFQKQWLGTGYPPYEYVRFSLTGDWTQGITWSAWYEDTDTGEIYYVDGQQHVQNGNAYDSLYASMNGNNTHPNGLLYEVRAKYGYYPTGGAQNRLSPEWTFVWRRGDPFNVLDSAVYIGDIWLANSDQWELTDEEEFPPLEYLFNIDAPEPSGAYAELGHDFSLSPVNQYSQENWSFEGGTAGSWSSPTGALSVIADGESGTHALRVDFADGVELYGPWISISLGGYNFRDFSQRLKGSGCTVEVAYEWANNDFSYIANSRDSGMPYYAQYNMSYPLNHPTYTAGASWGDSWVQTYFLHPVYFPNTTQVRVRLKVDPGTAGWFAIDKATEAMGQFNSPFYLDPSIPAELTQDPGWTVMTQAVETVRSGGGVSNMQFFPVTHRFGKNFTAGVRKPPSQRNPEHAQQRQQRAMQSMIPGSLGGRVANAEPTPMGSVTVTSSTGGSGPPVLEFVASFPGQLVTGTKSTPMRVMEETAVIGDVYATLGDAGTSTTVVELTLNDTPLGSLTFGSGQTMKSMSVTQALVQGDVLMFTVTTAGLDAADLTAQVKSA